MQNQIKDNKLLILTIQNLKFSVTNHKILGRSASILLKKPVKCPFFYSVNGHFLN